MTGAQRGEPALPGKRRIRDSISPELLRDFDGFSVEETNWSGAGGIEVQARTDDGRWFWFRVEVSSVRVDR